jgi:hypothetical protein
MVFTMWSVFWVVQLVFGGYQWQAAKTAPAASKKVQCSTVAFSSSTASVADLQRFAVEVFSVALNFIFFACSAKNLETFCCRAFLRLLAAVAQALLFLVVGRAVSVAVQLLAFDLALAVVALALGRQLRLGAHVQQCVLQVQVGHFISHVDFVSHFFSGKVVPVVKGREVTKSRIGTLLLNLDLPAVSGYTITSATEKI